MIKEHATSIRGKSHIRSGTVCQDAYRVLALPNGLKVAAVADGVGSSKCAERGSQIAVKTVTDFVADNYPIDGSAISIKSMLRTAYNRALIEIQKEALRNHNSMSDYDTTLMVVIYGGKHTFVAHVGDGGIVGLKTDGTYVELSQYQNVDGRVIPLRAGYEFWRIEEIEYPLASVLIATDGMMDQFRNTNIQQGFYIPLLMLFADPYVIQFERRKGVNIDKVVSQGHSGHDKALINALYHTLYRSYHLSKAVCNKIISDVVRNGTPFELLRKIQDDKTVVCLYNTSVVPRAQKIQYYSEPDWKKVSDDLQKRLYPSMFEDAKGAPEKSKTQESKPPVIPAEAPQDPPKSTDELLARVMLKIRRNE